MSFYQLKEPLEASKIESVEGNTLVLEGDDEVAVSDGFIGNNPCQAGNYYSPDGVIYSAAYFDAVYVEVGRSDDPDVDGDSGD